MVALRKMYWLTEMWLLYSMRDVVANEMFCLKERCGGYKRDVVANRDIAAIRDMWWLQEICEGYK